MSRRIPCCSFKSEGDTMELAFVPHDRGSERGYSTVASAAASAENDSQCSDERRHSEARRRENEPDGPRREFEGQGATEGIGQA